MIFGFPLQGAPNLFNKEKRHIPLLVIKLSLLEKEKRTARLLC
jgi:hypothetical protein